ncbi:MAG: hypothetical protein JWL77_3054 [Chthonomonadaceae bacterium]|nr:hypothetical protein [Chthonomonadaceae bacterium]
MFILIPRLVARRAHSVRRQDRLRFRFHVARTGTPMLLSACALIPASICVSGKPAAPETHPSAQRAFVEKYCSACHNATQAVGGFAPAKLDVAHPEQNAKEWERALIQLRAGMMPPAGAPHPEKAALRAFSTSLEAHIDRAASAHPNPGSPALHRLNRTEYANSVRDLLDLDVDVTSLLPPDDMSHGFDNMAEVLNVSPTLLAGYVHAAGRISREAIGEPKATPTEKIYHQPSTLSQTQHLEDTPFGTRGGIVIRHNFPADGEYIFKTTLYFTTNTFLFGMYQKGEQIEVAVNGERVGLFDVNPMMKVNDDLRTPPIKVKAGPQTISVAFLQKASGPVEDFVEPFEHSLGDLFLGRTQGLTGLPHVRDLSINGPYDVTGVSDTPSRRKIFLLRPTSLNDETPCAEKILSALAGQAYRRPLTDQDRRDLSSMYQIGRSRGDFDEGIRLGLQFILANPQFVFRFERTPANAEPGTNYRLTDLELASCLSYFLWSSGPDARLIALANQGKLRNTAVLEREVRRMLADPRSEALSTNFAGQWLHLRNLKDIQPDLFAFPNVNSNLLHSMRRETELFFTNLVQEDRDVMELLTADYTFVDENLARHYQIPDIAGPRFRKVKLWDENRRGLLGQAGILTVTSFANRTSPVVRGKWVLDTLLGAPPPEPPANVPPLQEASSETRLRTVRERLEEHRRNPACASCHTMMDPIGFALENYDATGAWRSRDSGFAIDATGQLVDGTRLDGPGTLTKALVDHSDAFLSAFTQKLLTYALGRGTEYYDMPAVRAIDRTAARSNNHFSAFVLGVVKSVPFQYRRAGERAGPEPTGILSNAPHPSGGNHVPYQKASLTSHGTSRARHLAGAALARLDGGRGDAAAQDGGGSEDATGRR